jgi:hypothetical protein
MEATCRIFITTLVRPTHHRCSKYSTTPWFRAAVRPACDTCEQRPGTERVSRSEEETYGDRAKGHLPSSTPYQQVVRDIELSTFRFAGWQAAGAGQGPSPVEGPMSVTRTRTSRRPVSCAAGSHAGSYGANDLRDLPGHDRYILTASR